MAIKHLQQCRLPVRCLIQHITLCSSSFWNPAASLLGVMAESCPVAWRLACHPAPLLASCLQSGRAEQSQAAHPHLARFSVVNSGYAQRFAKEKGQRLQAGVPLGQGGSGSSRQLAFATFTLWNCTWLPRPAQAQRRFPLLSFLEQPAAAFAGKGRLPASPPPPLRTETGSDQPE